LWRIQRFCGLIEIKGFEIVLCVNKMSNRVRLKKVSCVGCGSRFEVHSPDDLHTPASRLEKECEQSVRMDYECKTREKINTIHWSCRSRYPDWYA
jgi:hypothetical protein